MEGVFIWWTALSLASVVNLMMWALAARQLLKAKNPTLLDRRQIILSGGYVAVCAFRSFFPRVDVDRYCLTDTFLSSVLLGRSAATLAELFFVGQWALVVRELATKRRLVFATAVSHFAVPFIAVAEVFSWYAVLTT